LGVSFVDDGLLLLLRKPCPRIVSLFASVGLSSLD
jgi:hypothetical protein